jgi:putative ABC transport system permease protein
LLAGLIVLIGLMTVGNTLVTSVHQRRRDLAILKTIGFVRRQVAGCVAWQAMSFVVVAVLLGVPLGLAAGHWAWDLAASNINSMSPVLVPTLAIATIVPAALAWGIVISALPSWSAAQVRPAVVMRSE